MNLQRNSVWKRRGVSLLWDTSALSGVVHPADVVSIREFFAMAGDWPEDLYGPDQNALVVAGVEGCLDALTVNDGAIWLEENLKPAILNFQSEYQGGAALILWLPSGRHRIYMVRATEEYLWRTQSSKNNSELPIGRHLWAGAQSDVRRIIVSDKPNPDSEGDAYVGLYHQRIS